MTEPNDNSTEKTESTNNLNPSKDGDGELTVDDLISTQIAVSSDLLGVSEGDQFWLPVSPIRGDNFRAIRVEVKERRSAGRYEEENAIEPWDKDAERMGANPTLVDD